jgi:hypothetical protein
MVDYSKVTCKPCWQLAVILSESCTCLALLVALTPLSSPVAPAASGRLCHTPRPLPQWNDKDLDALLNDSDDEDAKQPPMARPDEASACAADDRQADRLGEHFAAIKLGGAANKKHDASAAPADSSELRAELDSLSLSGLYARSLDLFRKIQGNADTEGCPDTPAERDKMISTALSYLRRAEDVCDRAGIFSDNEAIEDVKTSDLKYLLLPSLVAELAGEEMDMDLRPAALERTEEAYMRFIQRCVDLKAAPESCLQACRRLLTQGTQVRLCVCVCVV